MLRLAPAASGTAAEKLGVSDDVVRSTGGGLFGFLAGIHAHEERVLTAAGLSVRRGGYILPLA